MARFWPVWALYGLVWLVALPLNLMTNYRGGGNWGGLDEGANHFANYTAVSYTHLDVYKRQEQSLGGYPAGVALGVAAASGLPDSVGVVSAGSGWAAAVISARRSTRAV